MLTFLIENHLVIEINTKRKDRRSFLFSCLPSARFPDGVYGCSSPHICIIFISISDLDSNLYVSLGQFDQSFTTFSSAGSIS